eukprot:TRINITY_DN2654_c0_g1_i1.p1 TRINITY_DN2654_c0_g1~~TRINITY_DN2654_c0_g1_i1.p1  ORF type:complete len:561 (+),score=142.71 TRINITY_DN2654_c0_g1_i1:79-1761(+)
MPVPAASERSRPATAHSLHRLGDRRLRRKVAGPKDHARRAESGAEEETLLFEADAGVDVATPRHRRVARDKLKHHHAVYGPIVQTGDAPTPRRSRRPAAAHARTTKGMLAHGEPYVPAMALLGGSPRSAASSPRRVPGAVFSVSRRGAEPVGLTINDELVVTDVIRGSAAEAAGIRPGTKLAAVGGRRVWNQQSAIAEFRSAGPELTVHVVSKHEAPHEFGVTAGVASDSPRFNRRRGPTNYGVPELLTRSRSAGPVLSRPPPGLGVPGLGPQAAPWGDADLPAARSLTPTGVSPLQGSDGFKPNLAAPHVHASPVRRYGIGSGTGTCNRTSYEVAAGKGQVNDAGHWHHPSTPKSARSLAREEYSKRNSNGDILRPDMYADRARQRGLSRAATPPRCVAAAVGHVPVPHESGRESPSGVRVAAGARTFNAGLLHHDPTVSDMSVLGRCSPRRTAVRHAHQTHGDITGCRWDDALLDASRSAHPVRGRRSAAPSDFSLPQPSAKAFQPTLRNSRPQPAESDIFHHRGHVPGSSFDMPDTRRGKGAMARASSPAQWADIAA